MSQMMDCKKAWLLGQGYTGAIPEMWAMWLEDQGFTGQVNDKEYAWLASLGYTEGNLEDRWLAYLIDLKGGPLDNTITLNDADVLGQGHGVYRGGLFVLKPNATMTINNGILTTTNNLGGGAGLRTVDAYARRKGLWIKTTHTVAGAGFYPCLYTPHDDIIVTGVDGIVVDDGDRMDIVEAGTPQGLNIQLTGGVEYEFCMILDTEGGLAYCKGGTEYPEWGLVGSLGKSALASGYLGVLHIAPGPHKCQVIQIGNNGSEVLDASRGPELLIPGYFNAVNAVVTENEGNRVVSVEATAGLAKAQQIFNFTAGEWYEFSFELVSKTDTAVVRVATYPGGTLVLNETLGDPGKYTFRFQVPTTEAHDLYFRAQPTGNTAVFKDYSLKRIEAPVIKELKEMLWSGIPSRNAVYFNIRFEDATNFWEEVPGGGMRIIGDGSRGDTQVIHRRDDTKGPVASGDVYEYEVEVSEYIEGNVRFGFGNTDFSGANIVGAFRGIFRGTVVGTGTTVPNCWIYTSDPGVSTNLVFKRTSLKKVISTSSPVSDLSGGIVSAGFSPLGLPKYQLQDLLKQFWCEEGGIGPPAGQVLIQANFDNYGPDAPQALVSGDVLDDTGTAVATIEKGSLTMRNNSAVLQNERYESDGGKGQWMGEYNISSTNRLTPEAGLSLEAKILSGGVSNAQQAVHFLIEHLGNRGIYEIYTPNGGGNYGITVRKFDRTQLAGFFLMPWSQDVQDHIQWVLGGYNAQGEPDPDEVGAYGAILFFNGLPVYGAWGEEALGGSPYAAVSVTYGTGAAYRQMDDFIVKSGLTNMLKTPNRSLFATDHADIADYVPENGDKWSEQVNTVSTSGGALVPDTPGTSKRYLATCAGVLQRYFEALVRFGTTVANDYAGPAFRVQDQDNYFTAYQLYGSTGTKTGVGEYVGGVFNVRGESTEATAAAPISRRVVGTDDGNTIYAIAADIGQVQKYVSSNLAGETNKGLWLFTTGAGSQLSVPWFCTRG